jgi:uncharacterized membrane protein YhiD involved in acid resistance
MYKLVIAFLLVSIILVKICTKNRNHGLKTHQQVFYQNNTPHQTLNIL